MKTHSLASLLITNTYPGRGIIIGKSEDGNYAVTAYFIMGRSANSRNRVFIEKADGTVLTAPFDMTKLEDPSLIIYAPVRSFENHLIVTNGDQTDTIYDHLVKGETFTQALTTREFEPDGPNFTPRISGIMHFEDRDFTYEMSILKSADEKGSACNRFHYAYAPVNGIGHFLHTYQQDGNPLPTFEGEPERVAVENDIDVFTKEIWNNLNEDNRISLYVRYVRLSDGKVETSLINRFQ